MSVQADLGQALFLVTRQLRCPEFNPYHVRRLLDRGDHFQKQRPWPSSPSWGALGLEVNWRLAEFRNLAV